MTEQEFEKELEARITQVENGVSEIRPMRKRDYMEVGIIVLICLAGIIAGAFL